MALLLTAEAYVDLGLIAVRTARQPAKPGIQHEKIILLIRV